MELSAAILECNGSMNPPLSLTFPWSGVARERAPEPTCRNPLRAHAAAMGKRTGGWGLRSRRAAGALGQTNQKRSQGVDMGCFDKTLESQ